MEEPVWWVHSHPEMQSRWEEMKVSIWGPCGVSLLWTRLEHDIEMSEEYPDFHQFALKLKAYMVPDAPRADLFLLKVPLELQSLLACLHLTAEALGSCRTGWWSQWPEQLDPWGFQLLHLSQCRGREGAGRREGGVGRCQASSYFKACTWTKKGHVFLTQIYKCLLPSTQDGWWEEVGGSFSYILSLLFKSLEVTRPRMQGVLKYGNQLFIMQMVGSVASIRPSRWSIRDLEFFSRQFFEQAWFLACKLHQYFRDTQLFCSLVVNSGGVSSASNEGWPTQGQDRSLEVNQGENSKSDQWQREAGGLRGR